MVYIVGEIYRINDKGAKTFGTENKRAKGKLVRITRAPLPDGGSYLATFITPQEWSGVTNLHFTDTQLDKF